MELVRLISFDLFYQGCTGFSFIASFILIGMILSNQLTSPFENGRVALLLTTTVGQFLYEVCVFLLLYIPGDPLFPCSISIPQFSLPSLIARSCLHGCAIFYIAFETIMACQFFLYIYKIFSAHRTADFHTEIFQMYRYYFIVVISIVASYEAWYWLTIGHSQLHLDIYAIIRLIFILAQLFIYAFAFFCRGYLVPGWLDELFPDNKNRAQVQRILDTYYIPVLLGYPMIETIFRTPILTFMLFCKDTNNQELSWFQTILLCFGTLGYLLASLLYILLYLKVEKPELSLEVFLTRINLNWILSGPQFHYVEILEPHEAPNYNDQRVQDIIDQALLQGMV